MDISLDGPKQDVVKVGVYRCKQCKKYFTVQPEGLSRRRRYTDRARTKIFEGVIQDKLTFLGSPHRAKRDFSIEPSVSTCWRWVQQTAGQIDIQDEYCTKVVEKFSGQLSIDEVSDGSRRMFVGTDPLQKGGPILGYYRADKANSEELKKFLTHLRDDLGITPKIVNHDDANIFNSTIKQVWPDCKQQLCHFHAIKWILYNYVRKSLTERIRNLPEPAKGDKEEKDRQTTLKQCRRWLMRNPANDAHRQKRPKDTETTADINAMIADWCQRYEPIGQIRALIVDFYQLMGSQSREEAEQHRATFLHKHNSLLQNDKHLRKGLGAGRLYDPTWFDRLWAFTEMEGGARTTNSTERANRWFRKRQKSHYRTRKESSTVNILNADLMWKHEREGADQ